ncbi:hypothetical protein [Leptolyngbya sp. FACHB-261]|nr:hypothetical protein [Leptolyngbya sp. FACHB-261]MBD2100688.1 hypothetical protein [Leptolyngbya sp. FACHB-261]
MANHRGGSLFGGIHGKGEATSPLPKDRILAPLKGRETLPLPTTVKL